MNLDIKPVLITQINEVAQMMGDFYTIDGYPFNLEKSTENFEYFINNDQLGQAFIIKHDDEVAGYMIINYLFSFEFEGHICFLDELYIKPNFQGKSLGKKAVIFAQEFAKIKALKLMYLEVENHNDRAINLYQNLGFEKHKRSLMFYKL